MEKLRPTARFRSNVIHQCPAFRPLGRPRAKESVKDAQKHLQTTTKVKTRETADSIAEKFAADDAPVEVEKEETPPAPAFRLKMRDFRVLAAHFYQPSLKEVPKGEMPWDDFLAAMWAIGFDAQRVYGSVWRFAPVATTADTAAFFGTKISHQLP